MDQFQFLQATKKAILALKKHLLIVKKGLNPYIYISFAETHGGVLTFGTSISNRNTVLAIAHKTISENILKQLQHAGMDIITITSFSGDGNNYKAQNNKGIISIAVGGITKEQSCICVGVIADILEQNKIIEF